MLPQRYRLRLVTDLNDVKQHGHAWRHPLVILQAKRREDKNLGNGQEQASSRFAFSASRRVGKAVVRNRAKRLLREAIRLHLAETKTGWDYLFIARPQTPQATMREVETAVLQLLARARLLAVHDEP